MGKESTKAGCSMPRVGPASDLESQILRPSSEDNRTSHVLHGLARRTIEVREKEGLPRKATRF